MPENYVLLERIELNATAASVTFANIPQTGYTDLKLVWSARGTGSLVYDTTKITFNGNASNYSTRYIQGSGSAASSGTAGTSAYIEIVDQGGNTTASTFGNAEIYIPNYTGSANKSVSSDVVSETNATTIYTRLSAGLWSNTSAITSITLTPDASAAYAAKSTFSLYGVAKLNTEPAIAPKATGGNVIATDGTYWYHAFLASGTFTPALALTADVLVVAGGGSGGTSVGGGGGAGGLLGFTSQPLTATSYTCTIGSGGAAVGSNTVGNDGSPSQFGALTQAAGGGGGGSYSAGKTGRNGGSGGGAGGWDPVGTGGSASPSGQGNAGGNVTGGSYGNGGSGGGGGAGTAGGSYSSGTTGASGGQGSGAYTAWASATGTGVLYSGTYYFAAGGPGVYGAGGTQAAASYGTVAFGGLSVPNTGQGGCGDYGYAGGSGIIIIRYPITA